MTLATRLAARAAIVLLSLGAACHWGPLAENFPPASRPVGARVALRVRGEPSDRVGELYAVDSAGVTVRGARLMHVRWTALQMVNVEGLDDDAYHFRVGGNGIGAERRERLAVVSRFPQGLSGELLARVLALVGQQTLDEVR